MENAKTNTDDLYIVAYVDEYNNVINFPKGGGSSTKPSIKAHDNYDSAKRSSRFFKGSKVVKAIKFEVVEGK